MRIHRKGLTLVEVMLALTITATIGIVAVSVTAAIVKAQDATDETVENVQAGRVSLSRLKAIIRRAKLLTISSPHMLVAWVENDYQTDAVNPDELICLRYMPMRGVVEMTRVSYPSGLPADTYDALNAPLPLNSATDLAGVQNAIFNSSYAATREIAAGLEYLGFSYDNPAPRTRIVTIDAQFGAGSGAIYFNTSVALRASIVNRVEYVDPDGYSLQPDNDPADPNSWGP